MTVDEKEDGELMKTMNIGARLVALLCLLLCVALLICSCVSQVGNGEGTAEQTKNDSVTTTAPTGGEQNPAGNEKSTYTVKIQTSEGGLEGVRVQACKGELCLAPVMTNATGVATIVLDKSENIADYHVKINKFPTGYAGSTTQEFSFAAGATSLTISLSEYKIKVTDMLTGIADVNVKIAKSGEAVANAKTDARGEVIFLLPADAYTATLDCPNGYQLTGDATSWELTAEQKSATVYLVGGNTTINKTVTVKDHDGNLKTGAEVAIYGTESDSPLATKTTDATGSVTFEGLNSLTNYRVVVTADSVTASAEFETFASTSLEITLPAPTAATEQTYKVTVKDADGATYTVGAVTVSLVFYDSVNNTFAVKSTAQTQNGVATFTLIPDANGFYYASIATTDLPTGYELTGSADHLFMFGETLDAEVTIRQAPVYGTEANPAPWNNYSNVTNNPFHPVSNEMTVTLAAGQTYYIQLAWSSGMQLTFTGDVTVTYGEETYAAGDVIVFVEASPMQGNAQAVIAITSTNGSTVTLTTAEYTEESNENDTEDGLTVAPNDDEKGWGELIPFH